jgi:hypothetical protein
MDAEIERQFQKVTRTRTTPLTINGLDALIVDALAYRNGVKVNLFVALYSAGGKTLVVFGAIRTARLAAHLGTVAAIVRSVRR